MKLSSVIQQGNSYLVKFTPPLVVIEDLNMFAELLVFHNLKGGVHEVPTSRQCHDTSSS